MLTGHNRRRQRGLTLLELLLATAFGGALLTLTLGVFAKSIAQHQALQRALHQRQQLRSLLELMTQELRRAGGWHPDRPQAGEHNPFTAPPTELRVSADGGCVLFAYDLNRNGRLDRRLPDERFGFRRRDGAVQLRKRGAGCEDGGWEDLTDPALGPVALSLTPLRRQRWRLDGRRITGRALRLRLRTTTPTATLDYRATVTLRNDRVEAAAVPAPATLPAPPP